MYARSPLVRARRVAAIVGGALLVMAGCQRWRDASRQSRGLAVQVEQQFGNRSDNDQVSNPNQMFVDGGGRLYIRERHGATILVLDHDGAFVRRLGQKGTAPGQIQEIGRMGLREDTVWATDTARNVLTLFPSATGKPVTRPFATPEGSDSLRFTAIAVFPDGTLLRRRETDAGSWRTLRFDRVEHRGKLLNRVAEFHCHRLGFGQDISDSVLTLTPLGGLPGCGLVATDASGRFLYTVDAKIPTSGDAGSIAISRIAPDGTVNWTSHVSYQPVPVSSATRDSLVQGASALEIVLGHAATAGKWKFYPPVFSAVVGHDGTLFIRRGAMERRTTWILLRPDGSVKGSLVLPSEVQVLEGDDQQIWADVPGGSGLTDITRYQIIKG